MKPSLPKKLFITPKSRRFSNLYESYTNVNNIKKQYFWKHLKPTASEMKYWAKKSQDAGTGRFKVRKWTVMKFFGPKGLKLDIVWKWTAPNFKSGRFNFKLLSAQWSSEMANNRQKRIVWVWLILYNLEELYFRTGNTSGLNDMIKRDEI